MSYQLPPELKTNKFNSLPENLRIKAEAIMAKKFGIPEVVEAKPKKKYPEPEETPETYNNDRFPSPGYQIIQIRIETDHMEPVYPSMDMGASTFDPRDMVRGTTRRAYKQNSIILDDRMPVEYKEKSIDNAIWDILRKIEHAGIGRRYNIILMSNVGTMIVNNRRDIFAFIERYT